MHNGSVRDGDTWFKVHLGAYAQWAKKHNSLLIITFDEGALDAAKNRIPTIIYGAHVRPGRYAERISHYNVFSTLLAMYGYRPSRKPRPSRTYALFGIRYNKSLLSGRRGRSADILLVGAAPPKSDDELGKQRGHQCPACAIQCRFKIGRAIRCKTL